MPSPYKGQFANFADHITTQVPVDVPEGLPEHGPSEVVRTLLAFRGYVFRIRPFMDERMRLLASISHDLRTPILAALHKKPLG